MGKYLSQAQAIRAAMDKASTNLADQNALEAVALYRPWKADETVVGGVRRHGDILYRCLQRYTTLSNWTPNATPSL